MWGSSAESPPVFSSAFALSCSDVFTINVRLLSVNTSIDTAQRFTAYASFRLSHLLNRKKEDRNACEWINLGMATAQTNSPEKHEGAVIAEMTKHVTLKKKKKKVLQKALGEQTIAAFFTATCD